MRFYGRVLAFEIIPCSRARYYHMQSLGLHGLTHHLRHIVPHRLHFSAYWGHLLHSFKQLIWRETGVMSSNQKVTAALVVKQNRWTRNMAPRRRIENFIFENQIGKVETVLQVIGKTKFQSISLSYISPRVMKIPAIRAENRNFLSIAQKTMYSARVARSIVGKCTIKPHLSQIVGRPILYAISEIMQ